MTARLLVASLLPDRLDLPAMLFGLVVFAGGIVMMFQHLRRWRAIEVADHSERVRTFEWHKFRRRTLVGALVGACGAVITSLSNTVDSYMYITLVTMLTLFLILILVLAILDLTAVSLFQFTQVGQEKRRAELEEIVRQQKLKQLRNDSTSSDS